MNRVEILPSPEGWIAAALRNLPAVLVDHALCEKKAAQMALRHATRFADWPGLPGKMSKLAREELVHFERVLEELRRRGLPYNQQATARYAAELRTAVKHTVDEMLACALIEARSHERFVLLAGAVEDVRLKGLYEDLLEAEARHGELYLELATEAAGAEEIDLAARLEALTRHEHAVVSRPGQPVRMHAGGA